MGIFFRKRIKIAKGLHVNVSKSGASLSVGPRGTKLNFSRKGVTAYASISGTGIYARETLYSTNKDKTKANRPRPITQADIDYANNRFEAVKCRVLEINNKLDLMDQSTNYDEVVNLYSDVYQLMREVGYKEWEAVTGEDYYSSIDKVRDAYYDYLLKIDQERAEAFLAEKQAEMDERNKKARKEMIATLLKGLLVYGAIIGIIILLGYGLVSSCQSALKDAEEHKKRRLRRWSLVEKETTRMDNTVCVDFSKYV